jgi:hypothetical protein
MRRHPLPPLMAETPRERLLREWSAARSEKERARVLAQWLELFPQGPRARAAGRHG